MDNDKKVLNEEINEIENTEKNEEMQKTVGPIDKIKILLNKKRNNLTTKEDIEKYTFLLELIKEKNCFFNLNMETVIGILEFLGVQEEEMIALYTELISPQNYQDSFPQERTIIKN